MSDENVNYKELYFKMVRTSEEAIRLLIRAQQACEAVSYCGGIDNRMQRLRETVKYSPNTRRPRKRQMEGMNEFVRSR